MTKTIGKTDPFAVKGAVWQNLLAKRFSAVGGIVFVEKKRGAVW